MPNCHSASQGIACHALRADQEAVPGAQCAHQGAGHPGTTTAAAAASAAAAAALFVKVCRLQHRWSKAPQPSVAPGASHLPLLLLPLLLLLLLLCLST
jgi:hypothetical protein